MIYYNQEQLAKFFVGAVVEVYSISEPGKDRQVEYVGHVVRFDLNSSREVIVLVACCDGNERMFHPYHLQPL